MSNQPFSIEMTTVGLVLWNPTSEDLEMQYSGISIGLKAGERQAFAIKCATHLLNAFGQRGLTSLMHGADEAKVGKAAIQRNLDFKTKQVVEFNQRNEARFNMKLGYLVPSETIKKYAKELTLKLMEPYQVRDEERAGIAQAGAENADLRSKLAVQEKEMAELKAMMKQFMGSQNTGQDAKTAEQTPQVDDKPERPSIRPGFKR